MKANDLARRLQAMHFAAQQKFTAALDANLPELNKLLGEAVLDDSAAAGRLQEAVIAMLGSPLCSISYNEWRDNPAALRYIEMMTIGTAVTHESSHARQTQPPASKPHRFPFFAFPNRRTRFSSQRNY